MISGSRRLVLWFSVLLLATSPAAAQSTAFTYQGKLNDSGAPASGSYDLQFKLFDAADSGNQVGPSINKLAVATAGGLFVVELDFGAGAFSGAPRFLEIGVRPAGSTGGFQQLLPRQAITGTPYSQRSLSTANADQAANAANAAQLGGIAASQYALTSDPRLTDARNPLPNSPNYLQNTTSPQASANFNITGDGLVGGHLGIGTSGPSTKLQVHSTGLDQHLYLSSAAPSLVLGNTEVRSSATMNGLFALSTAASHFGVEAGGLMIATYGNNRGNIYIDSNYSGTGVKNVILQPFAGSVGIGTSTLNLAYKLNVNGSSNGVYSISANGQGVYGGSTDGTGVFAFSTNGIALEAYSPNGQAGHFTGKVFINGPVILDDPGFGGTTQLCRNASKEIATCSSSLRYKTAIEPFTAGLGLINRLHPIQFTWKQGGLRDLGFGAEDVEKIEPLLVTYNDSGQVEGVKYDRIAVALVNAVHEQQALIEHQQQQITQQQREIALLRQRQQELDALKKLVCADHPDAPICKAN
jgi:hypothetical protein